MTTDSQKNNLLEQFRLYLEQSETEHGDDFPNVDLATLLGEMASLRTEVKTESRQFKNALDPLTSALDTLRADNTALTAELARHDEHLRRQQRDLTRGLMLELVEIRDRLTAGVAILENYRPIRKLFKRSRDRDIRFIQRIDEGQRMTANRLDQLLLSHQIRPIECVGKPLDPLTMTAVATDHDPTQGNGIVLEELRTGFMFQNQVLRLAQVKVNKLQFPVTPL